MNKVNLELVQVLLEWSKPCTGCIYMSTTRKRILVVDDDAVVLKALSIKLNAQGYEVLTEPDLVGVLARLKGGSPSTEGLEVADGTGSDAAAHQDPVSRPDLILLDIGFPAEIDSVPWDGFLIMEWLKRIDEAAKIPVIFISGSDPAQYEAKVRAIGAVAFFRKPIDHDRLFAVIEQTLAEKPAGRSHLNGGVERA